MELLNKYSKKLIKIDHLIKILKKLSKKKRIILCHGVFDVVHPGHIRHLTYAKSQADIMIVSCTGDKFIDKGIYRPHIPQKMRALNLAAFEMVDYVIIDENKKPFFLKIAVPKAVENTMKDVVKALIEPMYFTPYISAQVEDPNRLAKPLDIPIKPKNKKADCEASKYIITNVASNRGTVSYTHLTLPTKA